MKTLTVITFLFLTNIASAEETRCVCAEEVSKCYENYAYYYVMSQRKIDRQKKQIKRLKRKIKNTGKRN